jgi:hypothetical protein
MSHDIPNLGIIDGSVFVTSAAVNPTSTICALALRAARHLIENRTRIPVPTAPERRFHRAAEPLPPASVPPSPAPPLDTAQRALLAAIGDALIPPIDDLPGAGTLACSGGLLERVLSVRDDLDAPLRRALAEGADFPTLAERDPQAWFAVISAIAGSYYLDARVRRRIGYEGQVPQPVRPDNYPAYVAEGLLDHLLDGSWRAGWEQTRDQSTAVG